MSPGEPKGNDMAGDELVEVAKVIWYSFHSRMGGSWESQPEDGVARLMTLATANDILARLSRSTSTDAVTGWEIDRTTDSPILMYEKCSVIQDDQALYVMSLLNAAAPARPSLQGGAEPGDWTDEQAFELARHMCVAHGGDPDAPIYQGHGQVGENWQVYLPMATEALIFCRGVKP